MKVREDISKNKTIEGWAWEFLIRWRYNCLLSLATRPCLFFLLALLENFTFNFTYVTFPYPNWSSRSGETLDGACFGWMLGHHLFDMCSYLFPAPKNLETLVLVGHYLTCVVSYFLSLYCTAHENICMWFNVFRRSKVLSRLDAPACIHACGRKIIDWTYHLLAYLIRKWDW